MTTIKEAVQLMREGRLYSETWQRDWAWNKRHITELLDSAFRNYKIGSTLFWRRQLPGGDFKIGHPGRATANDDLLHRLLQRGTGHFRPLLARTAIGPALQCSVRDLQVPNRRRTETSQHGAGVGHHAEHQGTG